MAAVVERAAEARNLSRREFLYYIWGASLALFTVEFRGLLIWFLIPRSLDRFQLDILAADQRTVLASSELIEDFFHPVVLPPDATFVSIDTGMTIVHRKQQIGHLACLL